MALVLSSPGVSAATIAALEGVFRALGFESCQRTEALVQVSPRSSPPPQSLIPTVASRSQPAFTLYQNFLQQLASFRKHLDALGGPVGCALVALVAPRGQLRQPRRLIWELSCCEVLQGCPKVFLLLSSGPEGEWPGRGTWLWGGQRGGGGRPELHCRLVLLHPAAPESGPFLTSLRELCGRCPHWSLLQLLTEVGALGPLHWLAGAFPTYSLCPRGISFHALSPLTP